MTNLTVDFDAHRIINRTRELRDVLKERKDKYADPEYKEYRFTSSHKPKEYKAYRTEEGEALEKLEAFYKGMCKLIEEI